MARINQKTLLSWASFGVSFVMLVIMLASGLFSFSGRMGTVEGKIESLEANMSDGFDRLNARLISIEEALREMPPLRAEED